jgi:hypothetical protein
MFGIPRNIISDKDTRFLSAFWTTLWENMDTKIPSTNKWKNISSQHDFSATFKGLQSEASEDLEWKYDLYTRLI